MAVAEKTTTVAVVPQNPRQALMIRGVLGGLYLLASLWLVFVGLPALWRIVDVAGIFGGNEFLADSLLILVTLPTIFGLFLVGRMLEGPNPVRGLRACAVYLAASTIIFGLLICSGVNLWSVIGMVLLGGAIVLYLFQPAVLAWLVRVEEQGWFHAVAFKGNQGLRVRRTTVIALMVLVVCGIYTLINHDILTTGTSWRVVGASAGAQGAEAVRGEVSKKDYLTDPWVVKVPFGTSHYVFMYFISLTLPIVLFVLALWFSWRLVNWPTFADFLIATEAEMNKVSWTTKKRLVQDTVVVLVTVVLLTVFLFVLDVVWIKVLTNPFIQVLKYDTQEAVRKNQAGAQW
jgi:preprotein translocase SecE subunit